MSNTCLYIISDTSSHFDTVCVMCVCVCAAVTDDLLAAVYTYYKQKNLTLQTRSLLLSFYSKLYLQEQGHTHIAR